MRFPPKPQWILSVLPQADSLEGCTFPRSGRTSSVYFPREKSASVHLLGGAVANLTNAKLAGAIDNDDILRKVLTVCVKRMCHLMQIAVVKWKERRREIHRRPNGRGLSATRGMMPRLTTATRSSRRRCLRRISESR